MTTGSWEHFPHDADVGVRGLGATPAEAFAQAAMAMTAVITDPDCVKPTEAVEISCHAPDLEILLVDWLNALVLEMTTRKVLFARFDVALNDSSIKAMAYGEPIDVLRHQPATEVKGATFTELSVTQSLDGRWIAQCILDV